MPTYQYACTACGHQLEAVQSFSDEPLLECPVCEGRLRKLFSAVGIVFKGSGFYRTDSRNGGKVASEAASSPKESAPAPAAKESAPAPASAPKPAASTSSSNGSSAAA